MGLFTLIYTWISEYLFEGFASLPTTVQAIVPELSTLISLLGCVFVLFVPCWIIYALCRVVFSWGRL